MAKLRRTRAKRLVLDIGSSAIRLCEMTQTKSGYQLTKYYQRELVIDPTLDEEEKKRNRSDALKALLKHAKVRTRKTVLAVPGRSVFTRTRLLPPVPEYKVTQIVRYEIQQQIPFSLDQIALDYQILNRTEAGGYDVIMAAIKVDVVEKHLDILRDAKRSIDTVDVCPIAAYNWLKHAGEFGHEGECVALLDLGASTTDIVIERGNQFRFTRPLNLAGDDITCAIRDTLGLSFADAEKLKRERGFAPTGDPKRDGKLGEAIGSVLAKLVMEINRSFAYFRSLPGGGPVERVIVTGGGACLRNIVPYFQRQLGVEVRIARPLAGLAIAPGAQEANEHPEQSSVVLGMALRFFEAVPIQINLIPPEIIQAARRREQMFYWILSFVVLALIAASIIPARANKDKLTRDRIELLKQYIRCYDPVLEQNPSTPSVFEDELEVEKRNVDLRKGQLDTLAKAYRNCKFWLNELRLLNNLRPEGGTVWFSLIETSVVSPARVAAADRVNRPGGRSAASGVISTGFPGLAPRVQTQERSGVTPAAAVGTPRPGSQVIVPPVPNGYRIYGYAKDPDSLTLFINRLRENQKFQKVYFNEADVEKVPITELDNARVSRQVAAAAQPGAAERRPGLRTTFSELAPNRAGPVAPNVTGEAVIFFRVDVQTGPSPIRAVTPEAAGAAETLPGALPEGGFRAFRKTDKAE
jgi:type IV pilus assembly protein PilM